jgi:molybdenum cofactor synthesis domain-containing protein
VPTAAIITIGDELLCGDVVDTNAVWLAKHLERAGVHVQLVATVPDDVERIGGFVRNASAEADVVLVTGGLGGTPDDLTREGIAAAFDVPREQVPEVAERLRERFPHDPDYALRWADLPQGSRPLDNPLGGAPGFVLGNVYVFPGLPSEMEAMFARIEDEFRGEQPIGSWRRSYRTTESRIVGVLEQAGEQHPTVRIGSYPSFGAGGGEVEIVLKSTDPAALDAASAWLEHELSETGS